jgi:hypothetical protein
VWQACHNVGCAFETLLYPVILARWSSAVLFRSVI